MVMCAFLGITKELLESEVPYVRVLAFNDKGRELLKEAKNTHPLVNIGQKTDHPYYLLEQKCGTLYGLFAMESPGCPEAETKARVYYQK